MAFLDGSDLERILGWHDSGKIHVISEALNSPAVMAHEAIHGRLFNETPDGHLHRMCCIAADSEYDRRLGGIYATVAQFLFGDTREAHEAAATYLGIMGLPTEAMREEQYSKLPRDYRGYYGLLDKFAKPLSSTTWLRYAFAWTLCHWCFHSMRSSRFFSLEIPNMEVIQSIASPTDRLHLAIAALTGERLSRWRDESIGGAIALCQARGVQLWDIEDEEEWNRHHSDDAARTFENFLTHRAGYWLLDNMPIETEDYRIPDPRLGVGFENLVTALNLHAVSHHRGPETELDPAAQPFLLRRLAFERGADTISHKPWSIPLDLRNASPEQVFEEVAGALPGSSDLFFLSNLGRKDSMLVSLQSKKNVDLAGAEPHRYEEVATYNISTEFVLRLAQSFIAVKQKGGLPGIQIWALLSARQTEMAELLITSLWLSSNVVDAVSGEGPPVSVIPREQIVLYWHDNWAKVDDIPSVAVTSVSAAFADTGEIEGAKRLSIRVSHTQGTPFGYILAVKNAWSGSDLDKYESQRIADGSLQRLDIPEDTIIREVLAPVMVAWSLWDRF